MKIELPIYYNIDYDKEILVGMNWYRNAHYRVSNEVKHYYHELIVAELPRAKTLMGTVHINYSIYVKNSKTDGPNVRSVIEKFFLDALKIAGHIKDDNVTVVVSDTSAYYIDKDNPRAEIEIVQL